MLLLSIVAAAPAHAAVALLLEQPFGTFGEFNPTGHAAIYFNHVCAATPTELRPCRPGETGVVISRYHHIDGYDWLAIPLIPYLYAVDSPLQVPATVNKKTERRLRNIYREHHLMSFVQDDPPREFPPGEWVQLIGASYDRQIWGFELPTSAAQDAAFIQAFNNHTNIGHFNLFFNNCANFAAKVLDFYYPHIVHRNFIADAGLMTPKQVARSLLHYERKHPQADLQPFLIRQIAGTIHRSTHTDGVIEALLRSKKYVVPLVVLEPVVTGGLAVAYLTDGRMHLDQQAPVFDPALEIEPLAAQIRTRTVPATQPRSQPSPHLSPAPAAVAPVRL